MENKLPFEKVKRTVLVRKESITNPNYGTYPEKRNVKESINYGIINLNKVSGPTSHQVVDYVKGILDLDKAGHSGTLDPGVTGVLPIALGKATRVVQVLLTTGKEYVALMYLHDKVSEEKIIESSKKFTGKINQLPPVRSAVKRQVRQREVYYLKIIEIKDQFVLFRVGTEAGTYIRKIIHDWGRYLGCNAHMVELVRTKVGPFDESNWVTLHDLKDAYEFYKEGNEAPLKKIILPVEMGIQHLPKVWILDSCVDTLCHGADLSTPGISKLESGINENDIVAVLTLKDELVCLGQALFSSEEILKKEKTLVVKSHKIFMEPNIYPKFIKKN